MDKVIDLLWQALHYLQLRHFPCYFPHHFLRRPQEDSHEGKHVLYFSRKEWKLPHDHLQHGFGGDVEETFIREARLRYRWEVDK